jgi:hypothetical protein
MPPERACGRRETTATDNAVRSRTNRKIECRMVPPRLPSMHVESGRPSIGVASGLDVSYRIGGNP